MIRRAPGYQLSTPKMERHAESSWYRRTTVEGSVAGPCKPVFITLSSRSTKTSLKSGSFFMMLYLDNDFTADSFTSVPFSPVDEKLAVSWKILPGPDEMTIGSRPEDSQVLATIEILGSSPLDLL